jgi:hypothetical protein
MMNFILKKASVFVIIRHFLQGLYKYVSLLCYGIYYSPKKLCDTGPSDHIHNNSFSSKLKNGLSKIKCLSHASHSNLALCITPTFWTHL